MHFTVQQATLKKYQHSESENKLHVELERGRKTGEGDPLIHLVASHIRIGRIHLYLNRLFYSPEEIKSFL